MGIPGLLPTVEGKLSVLAVQCGASGGLFIDVHRQDFNLGLQSPDLLANLGAKRRGLAREACREEGPRAVNPPGRSGCFGMR